MKAKDLNNALRIKEIMGHFHLNQTEFAEKTGIPKSNLSKILGGSLACGPGTMNKIVLAFTNLNKDWILYGVGEMLANTTPTINQTNIQGDITVNGNHNSHIGHASAHCENCGGEIVSDVQELQGAPVIPTALCREGGCDILEYIEENPEEVEISPIRAKGVTIDLWYRIRATDNSNAPTYLPGDNIALPAILKARNVHAPEGSM